MYEFKNYNNLENDTLKLVIEEGKRHVDDLLFIQHNINTKSWNLALLTLTFIVYVVKQSVNFQNSICLLMATASIYLAGSLYVKYIGTIKAQKPSAFLTHEHDHFDTQHVNKAMMIGMAYSYEKIANDISSINRSRGQVLNYQIYLAVISVALYIINYF